MLLRPKYRYLYGARHHDSPGVPVLCQAQGEQGEEEEEGESAGEEGHGSAEPGVRTEQLRLGSDLDQPFILN